MNKYNQTPYTYVIGWRNLDTWYYGSRRANKVPPEDDLWKVYNTSSSHVKEFTKQHGEPDVIKVHKSFLTEREAYLFEKKFLKRVNAKKSHRWLNKSVNNWDVEKEPRTGWHHSEETKQKISAGNKGKSRPSRKWNDEQKRALSEKKKTFWTIEEREKQSVRSKELKSHEYFHTPEAYAKRSETMKTVRANNPDMFKKTDEHKKKISESRFKFLEENGPQLHTDETKAKMSVSAKRSWTPERRAAQADRAKKQHASRKSLIG